MRLSGEAYSQRLETFSDSTIQLIMDIDSTGREKALKTTEITANPDYSEEEVVKLLLELKAST